MILSGQEVAKHLQVKITEEVKDFTKKFGVKPRLDVVLVGNDSASQVYVSNKKKACEKVGIDGHVHNLSSSVAETEVLNKISELNANESVDGILLQLPLPQGLDGDKIISHISPLKDPDCLTAENIGLMWLGRPRSVSCTPQGIRDILEFYKIDLEGKKAVVIGRSNIVGKPMAQILLSAGATVTICHSKTKNLKDHTLEADVVVVAIGKPKALGKEYFSKNTVVIDVGIHRQTNGLCGDVDFDEVSKIVKAITPVPGGVGPMTISSLLKNTLRLAILRRSKNGK